METAHRRASEAGRPPHRSSSAFLPRRSRLTGCLETRHYAPATINLRLAAVWRVAYEAADAGLLSPELAAGIRRVKGVRTGRALGQVAHSCAAAPTGNPPPTSHATRTPQSRHAGRAPGLRASAGRAARSKSVGFSNARSNGSSLIWSVRVDTSARCPLHGSRTPSSKRTAMLRQ
jgi:hypothetical protein